MPNGGYPPPGSAPHDAGGWQPQPPPTQTQPMYAPGPAPYVPPRRRGEFPSVKLISIMVLLGVLLAFVGAIWIVASSYPDYGYTHGVYYDASRTAQQRDDALKSYWQTFYTNYNNAQIYGRILAVIGLLLAGLFLALGLLTGRFEASQQGMVMTAVGMIIVAMVLILMFPVITVYPYDHTGPG